MRNLFACCVILFACSHSFAQATANLYLRKGNKITLHNYDRKGREVNFKEITIDSIRTSNGDTTSYFSSRGYVLRGFGKQVVPGSFKSDLRIATKKDNSGFYLNYAIVASGEDNNSMHSITVNIVEDEFLFYPKIMMVGQSIGNPIEVSGDVVYRESEWSANNSAQVQGKTFGNPETRRTKVYVRVTDRKVTGTETIKVGDKMVDCFVIEHTAASSPKKNGNYKAEEHLKEWYSPIYGLLQIEKYTDRDKLAVTGKVLSL